MRRIDCLDCERRAARERDMLRLWKMETDKLRAELAAATLEREAGLQRGKIVGAAAMADAIERATKEERDAIIELARAHDRTASVASGAAIRGLIAAIKARR